MRAHGREERTPLADRLAVALGEMIAIVERTLPEESRTDLDIFAVLEAHAARRAWIATLPEGLTR